VSQPSISATSGGLGPAWRVTAVNQTTGQDSTGRYTQGKEVSFTLASGVSGTVFVPDNMFNPDAVKAAIMAEAANLHQVSNLSYGQ
jgi:hypothetical protein